MNKNHKHKWLSIGKSEAFQCTDQIFERLKPGLELQRCEDCTMLRQAEWAYYLNE